MAKHDTEWTNRTTKRPGLPRPAHTPARHDTLRLIAEGRVSKRSYARGKSNYDFRGFEHRRGRAQAFLGTVTRRLIQSGAAELHYPEGWYRSDAIPGGPAFVEALPRGRSLLAEWDAACAGGCTGEEID